MAVIYNQFLRELIASFEDFRNQQQQGKFEFRHKIKIKSSKSVRIIKYANCPFHNTLILYSKIDDMDQMGYLFMILCLIFFFRFHFREQIFWHNWHLYVVFNRIYHKKTKRATKIYTNSNIYQKDSWLYVFVSNFNIGFASFLLSNKSRSAP